MKKAICFLILPVVLLLASVMPVAAIDSAPTDNFTHWEIPNGQSKAIYMPAVFETIDSVSARSLGLSRSFGEIKDIDCDESGNTYVLTNESRIVSFDSNLKFKREYTFTNAAGEQIGFTGALGIYTPSENEIYIADTEKSRVLHWKSDTGLSEIVMPKSALIPSDFTFRPINIERDAKGFLYVISEGSYYGALLYTPQGEFNGFYGANTVGASALTAISYVWDKLTQNDIKRSKVQKKLPYQFIDIKIDKNGFVYTCTGITSSGNSGGQIRMLSPGGQNILFSTHWDGTRSSSDGFNFGESDYVKRRKMEVKQNFIGIESDGNGYIYTLDKTYGLIYVYDTECNLITAFGGGSDLGKQTGIFSSACAIALSGDRIMVADSLRKTITVFRLTDFGKVLMKAQKMTINSDYLGAKPLWNEVMKSDANNRLALRGLAKAAYSENNYKEAIRYEKLGLDTSIYDQAHAKLQSIFIEKNFWWIFPGAILLLIGLTMLIYMATKRQMVIIKNKKLRLLVGGILHPFRSFDEIKYKKMGSIRISIVMIFLFYISSVMSVTLSDFRFTTFDASSYNALFQIVQTAGLILLWSISNWSVSVLQEGKGRLKEVFIVTSYSTLPLVITNLLSIPLTYLLSSQGAVSLGWLHTAGIIFTMIMLTVGHMIVHEFSFPRFLFSSFLSCIFILLIIFILFIIGVLLSQFWSFFVSIFLEVTYRS